jgi:hypothetical protein
VDNDYDMDDLNKEAVFKIPPVPFGNIDKFDIETIARDNGTIPEDLDLDAFDGTPIDLETGYYSETIENLFTEDIIDKFFFEGAGDDVVLKADADIHLLRNDGEEENLEFLLNAVMRVTDESGNELPVIIPYSGYLYSKDNQPVEVRFPKEYFHYMKDASGLKFTFGIKTHINNIGAVLDGDNYIQLRNVLLTSAGMKFKF